jgi:MFS family permease
VLLIQLASNIVQGPWQALIPDLVPEPQRGQASGLKAMFDILAFVIGRGIAGQLMGRYPQWGETAVVATVTVPVVVFAVALLITALWAREKPEPAVQPSSQSVGDALKKAFAVDFRAHPAFGWWFANRLLFWAGFILLNTFLVTYAMGVLAMAEADAQKFVGTLSTILGAALVVVTLPSGWLADRLGRKPIAMVSGVVSGLGTLFLLTVRDTTLIAVGAAVVGVGIGSFLSANWALVTDIVPRDEAARYLGIANIATAGGSALARLLGGALIDPLNHALHSASAGYLIVYGLAAAFFLASTVVIAPLPKKV